MGRRERRGEASDSITVQFFVVQLDGREPVGRRDVGGVEVEAEGRRRVGISALARIGRAVGELQRLVVELAIDPDALGLRRVDRRITEIEEIGEGLDTQRLGHVVAAVKQGAGRVEIAIFAQHAIDMVQIGPEQLELPDLQIGADGVEGLFVLAPVDVADEALVVDD